MQKEYNDEQHYCFGSVWNRVVDGIIVKTPREINHQAISQALKQSLCSDRLAAHCSMLSFNGSKKRYRDFVYIDDTVEACILAAKGQEKELFNVYTTATNRKTTCEQLIKIMKTELPFEITA